MSKPALVPTKTQHLMNISALSLAKFPPKISYSWGLISFPCYKSVSRNRFQLACLAANGTSDNVNDKRRLADFPSNIWKDIDTCFTSTSSASRNSEFVESSYGKQIEEVKEMLIAPTDDPAKKVGFINLLCRLGVSYHFKAEIDQQLNHIFDAHYSQLKDHHDYDLYTVALLFRVFRQYGYKMSSEVFEKFMDDGGKFKEFVSKDAMGMLSLYEAAHLRVDGEDVLEEAIALTKANLPSLADKSSPHVAKHIFNALEMPFHKGIPRLETYQYISYYQQDQHRNQWLLNFAKADFNQLQLLHQQEITQLRSWWKDLNLPSKLPYIRDRIMELYFWSVAIYYEPCYSRARLIFTKVLKMMSVLDDTYDSYGTLEELKLFTDALQKWDTSSLDQLPDYMKIIYSEILNLFYEIDKEVAEEGRSYCVAYTKDTLKEMVRAYLQETQWFEEEYEPTFDEYMDNAFVTVGSLSISSTAFIGMEMAGIASFEWLHTWPNVVKAAYKIGRLLGDITSHQFEQKRGHVASGVESYMKQYGISREETVEEFRVMFEKAWKDMNEECMKPIAVPMEHLLRVVNIARLVEVTYKEVDGYTNPEYLKDYITKMFIDRMIF
ncbi:hypothetical protein EZV62_001836 [Acer yangbiense]|uniref:(+)-delta-cadinene synthase n=1 Tax=Acer yangbiense TaxID=1000413 RepID=A0A5C7IVA7_9ROSI|nr:hypothetical protein EZV62_001836 [Acer yangbiense]